jgi:FkbM family methyltransferase
MLLRSAAEQASHRIVFRRRLPSPFAGARLYVSSEGGLRYLRGSMAKVDPVLLRLASEFVKPGDVVWDIGANLGLFSFAASGAAGPGGQVLAVEADTELTGLLRRSARANAGCGAPVEVLPSAVSDQVSVARFQIARRNRSTSHLAGYGTTMAGGLRSSQLVPSVTLDWLADRFPAPGVVKIDVEGAELAVLAGAGAVLAGRPVILCEVGGDNARAVADLLIGCGYRLFDGDRLPGQRVPVSAAPYNTLAVAASS